MDKNSLYPSLIVSILFILTGVLVLLLGMKGVALVRTDLWASYIDVLFVALSLVIVCRGLHLKSMVGKRPVITFITLITCMTILLIAFARSNVFIGNEGIQMLSAHDEHNLTYESILALSHAIEDGSISNAHELALTYGQYAYTYLYSSLMYVFGGDVITHICVWNGFHLGIIAILCVLIACELGVTDKKSLGCILLLAVLQPSYMTFFAYNRSIIGEAFLLLGLFIFVKSYKTPLKLFLFLPIYGFLFYAFRLQYLITAIGMFLIISIVPNTKRKGTTIIAIFIATFVLLYLNATLNWEEDVEQGLNVENYTNAYSGSFLKALLLGLIGKFPWTNWFYDDNWTYHMFLSLQAPMMLVLYYYTFKIYKNNLRGFIYNPVLLCAVFILASGMISSTHTAYLAVAAPMLVICVSETGLSKILSSYFKLSMVYIVLSLIWFVLGLSGTGIISGQ